MTSHRRRKGAAVARPPAEGLFPPLVFEENAPEVGGGIAREMERGIAPEVERGKQPGRWKGE